MTKRYGLVLCLVILFSSSSSWAVNPEPIWRLALAGAISTYPAQGPGGDVYVIADDRALHAVNPQNGAQQWIYRPGGRLKSLLLVAPDGTIYVENDRLELFAVTPGGTGRWKLRMGRDTAALPAAAPDGRLVLPLEGGRVVCLSRHGRILWTTDFPAEVSAAPIIDEEGHAWLALSDGSIHIVDRDGEDLGGPTIGRAVAELAFDGLGRIWVGSFGGQCGVYDRDLGDWVFLERPSVSRVSAILTNAEGSGEFFMADGLAVSYNAEGTEIGRRQAPASGGAPSVTGNGTLYLPVVDGSIRVIGDEGEIDRLEGRSVLAEPLIAQGGVLVAGGGDWLLYAWSTDEVDSGWSQFRGGATRSGLFPREPDSMDRLESRNHPGFFWRERLARSQEWSDQNRILDELESFSDERAMLEAIPWAPLLMEDLASGGTLRSGGLDRYRGDHPTIRARAYTLLGRGEDFRNRDFLMSCLLKENDPAALAAGFRALGRIGSDWDGAATRLMASRYRVTVPKDDRLALQTALALSDLVRYNGEIPDPAGMDLMQDLLESSLSPLTLSQISAEFRSLYGL